MKKPTWCYKKPIIDNLEEIQQELNLELLKYNRGVYNFSRIKSEEVKEQLPLASTLLQDMGLYDRWSHVILVKVENEQWNPHIDCFDWKVNSYSFNIPLKNCENSYTVFYEGNIINEKPQKNKYMRGTDESHRTVDPESLVEICRVDANQPLWINTTIPHTPIVYHKKPRLNACFRFIPEIHDYFDND